MRPRDKSVLTDTTGVVISFLCLLLFSSSARSQILFKANGPVVRQSNPLTCGAATIATLLTFYYDDATTEEEILKLTEITKRGASIESLEKALSAKRYEVQSYPMTLLMLLKEVQEAPVIALFEGEIRHYVIVIGTVGDYFLIADPARGEVLRHRNEFLKLWTIQEKDLHYGKVLKVKSPHRLNKDLIERRKNSAAARLQAVIRAATWTDSWRY